MIKGKSFFTLGIALSLVFASCVHEQSKKNIKETKSKKIIEMTDQISALKVEAKLDRGNLIRGVKPCPVTITLFNSGSEPLMINKRLAVGYRDSDSRELFAEVYKRGKSEVVSVEIQDYNRSPASKQDYGLLQPGEFITATFDFCEWYNIPLEVSGQLEMVVFYRADEQSSEKPNDVLKGVIKSRTFEFEILD